MRYEIGKSGDGGLWRSAVLVPESEVIKAHYFSIPIVVLNETISQTQKPHKYSKTGGVNKSGVLSFH